MSDEYVTIASADFRARCWISGTTKDKEGKITYRTGCWHERHHHHPWVRESEIEGWSKELRTAIVIPLKKLIFRQQYAFKTFPALEDLMPGREWVEAHKRMAVIAAEAAEWQDENLTKTKAAKTGFVQLADVSRRSFQAMQRRSRNTHLHADHAAIAKRIIGDRT